MKIICHEEKKMNTMQLFLLLNKIEEQSNLQEWQMGVKYLPWQMIKITEI